MAAAIRCLVPRLVLRALSPDISPGSLCTAGLSLLVCGREQMSVVFEQLAESLAPNRDKECGFFDFHSVLHQIICLRPKLEHGAGE